MTKPKINMRKVQTKKTAVGNRGGRRVNATRRFKRFGANPLLVETVDNVLRHNASREEQVVRLLKDGRFTRKEFEDYVRIHAKPLTAGFKWAFAIESKLAEVGKKSGTPLLKTDHLVNWWRAQRTPYNDRFLIKLAEHFNSNMGKRIEGRIREMAQSGR